MADSGIDTDLSEDLNTLQTNHDNNNNNKRSSFERINYKFDDPLSEPIVKMSLQKVKITPNQLINMSVKELNRKLVDSPSFVVSKLKRCRRTLKNRGYAKNCRIKRIAAKNHLEQVNMKLALENRELRRRNKALLDQLSQFRTNQVTSVEAKLEQPLQVESNEMIIQPSQASIYTTNQLRAQFYPEHESNQPFCNSRQPDFHASMPDCTETTIVYHNSLANDFNDHNLDNLLLCEATVGLFQQGVNQ